MTAMSEPRDEIAKRLSQVFWGLLLVILDIRLNQFDILPDFLGYGLVAVGAGELTGLSSQFATARVCAWVLVVLAIVELFPYSGPRTAIALAHLVFNCVMMWSLLGGIMDYSTAKNRPDLAEQASNRRIAYIALMSIVTFLGFVAGGSDRSAGLLAFVIVVCMLVLVVMILHLIHRVKTELAT